MRTSLIIGFGAYLVIGLTILAIAYSSKPDYDLAPATSVSTALGKTDMQGYQRAYQPREFAFPADHGPHPDFRTEWWYATGNLADGQGHEFGYQLTLFRIALSPHSSAADSAWRTNQIYMGHFAITDVTGQRHYAFERFSRAALGLAGAQAVPFRVWLENWSLEGRGENPFPVRVQAREQGLALDLTLEPQKPLVLQGERGLSQKSHAPGNASYYYSYTRLGTRGSVAVNGRTFKVSGTSWLDREWSTSALGPEQSGWDWFALQLNDSRELMFYRLRLKSGEVDPHSSGVLVAADGSVRKLAREDVQLKILETWTSPHSRNRYPSRWVLRLPAEKLELMVTPKLADQEMRLQVRYWEGAVAVTGLSDGKPISGEGYLEMTRYE